MKKILFGLMILAGSLIATDSFAQHHKADPGERAKKVTEKMKSELSLTDAQYKKVYDINLKYGEQMKGLRRAEGDREKRMNEIRSVRKAQQQELKAVLSAEQMEKYRNLQKESREKAKEHRKTS